MEFKILIGYYDNHGLLHWWHGIAKNKNAVWEKFRKEMKEKGIKWVSAPYVHYC